MNIELKEYYGPLYIYVGSTLNKFAKMLDMPEEKIENIKNNSSTNFPSFSYK